MKPQPVASPNAKAAALRYPRARRKLVRMRVTPALGVAASVLWAAMGCSGSPHTGGPDSGSPVDSGSGQSDFSVSPNLISFYGRVGDVTPAPQIIHVSSSKPIVVKAQAFGGFATATLQASNTNLADILVQPVATVGLSPGTMPGTVQIIACTDYSCATHLNGSPQIIPLTYTLTAGGIITSANALTFTGPAGSLTAPPAQTVNIRDLDGGSFSWSTTISGVDGGNWLSVAPQSGAALPSTASVQVSALPGPGTFGGTVSFFDNGSSYDVPVTYLLATPSFQVSPATLNVVGSFGTAGSPQTVTLSDGAGFSYPWTATLTYPANDLNGWAIVQSAGGGLPATITITFAPLPDKVAHQATLNLNGSGTARTVSISYSTP